MSDKDGIDSMMLGWSFDEVDEDTVDSQMKRDILDKLRTHANLKQLHIEGVVMLPSLGQLPSLKHLSISYFASLTIVGAEFYFYQNDESCLETPPFPMFETLSIHSMWCWKEWCLLELNAFPRLRELTIRKCPMLRGDLPNQLTSLQSLKIEECDELSCCVPKAPEITTLSISTKHLVGSVVEAIKNTQLSCLTSLSILDCSSQIWFPVSAILPSLQQLRIEGCRKLEIQMDGQHHSLQELYICSSCDSLASFSLLDSFLNLVHLQINNCGNMESIVVSRSLSYLRFLYIDNCRSLKYMAMLWMATPQLEQLSLVACPKIDLSDTGHPHHSFRFLEISNIEKLVSSAAFMHTKMWEFRVRYKERDQRGYKIGNWPTQIAVGPLQRGKQRPRHRSDDDSSPEICLGTTLSARNSIWRTKIKKSGS